MYKYQYDFNSDGLRTPVSSSAEGTGNGCHPDSFFLLGMAAKGERDRQTRTSSGDQTLNLSQNGYGWILKKEELDFESRDEAGVDLERPGVDLERLGVDLERREWILIGREWILKSWKWILKAVEWILKALEWILKGWEWILKGRKVDLERLGVDLETQNCSLIFENKC